MKRLLIFLSLALIFGGALAQTSTYVQIRAEAAFTGTCVTGSVGISKDTYNLFVCEAAAWSDKGGITGGSIGGTGAATNRLVLWSGTTAIKGIAELIWDGTTNTLLAENLAADTGGSISGPEVRATTTMRTPTIGGEGAACTYEGQIGYQELNAPQETEFFVCSELVWRRLLRDDAGNLSIPDGLRINPDSDADSTGVVSVASLCLDTDGTGCDATLTTTAYSGNSASSTYSTTARGLKAADSTGVPNDVDGDGTTDFMTLNGLGTRGTSADSNSDGTNDNPLYPAFRKGEQGFSALTPWGIGSSRTLPDRGIEPVIVIGLDEHPSDSNSLTVAQAVCASYQIPCSIFPHRHATGDSYPTSAELQAWNYAGNSVGGHGDRHDHGGYDSIDGSLYWGDATRGGLYKTGTAVCTNGSTAVVGTGTNWDPSSYPTNVSLQSEQMYFVCDDTNDGVINNNDRAKAILVSSIADATHLTLAKAFTGTTSSPARSYEMRSGYPKANWEISSGLSALQGVLGSGYFLGSFNDPGPWNPSDDVAVLAKAAQGIPYATALQATSYDGSMPEWVSFGSFVDPLRVNMNLTNCYWKAADMAGLVDTIIKERAFYQVNVEDVVDTGGTCTASGSWITRAAFDALLSAIHDARDAGKVRVMTAEAAARYVRSIPTPQYSTNIVRNYSFYELSGGANSLGGADYAWIPGWRLADSDSTSAHVQHTGKTGTWSGDGAGTMTYTKASSGEYDEMVQCYQLHPNQEYFVAAELDCTEVTSNNIYIKITDRYTSTDSYATTNADDIARNLDPVWYQGNTAGFSYRTTGASQTCTAGYHTWVTGYFRTPSLLNEAVCLRLVSNSAVGTARWKNLSLVARHPNYQGTAWGSGMGLKFTEISRAAPYKTGGRYDEAFHFEWVPSDASYDSTASNGPDGTRDTAVRMDTPTVDLFGWHFAKANGTAQKVFYGKFQATSQLDLYNTGTIYTDPDDDGTLESVACGVGGKADTDCDGSADYAVGATTVDSDGTATKATATITPLTRLHTITCNDTDGCTITLGESGVPVGFVVTLICLTANDCEIDDAAGVADLSADPFVLADINDSLTVAYMTNTWVQIGSADLTP